MFLPAERQIGRHHAGRGRARRGVPFRFRQALPRQGSARGASLPRPQGGRDGLFQADRHLSNHARRRPAQVARGRASMARRQPVQGL